MMTTVPSVYISGALTAVADLQAARAYYESLADVCRVNGLEPTLPHLYASPDEHRDLPAELVYSQDLENIVSAAIVLAHVGAPSLGVGAELAIAAHEEIPIVALSRPGETVSRFLLGLLRRAQAHELIASDQVLTVELPPILHQALAEYRARKDQPPSTCHWFKETP